MGEVNFRKMFIAKAINHLWNYKLDRLNDWERDEFLPSIKKIWERGYDLSQKQFNTLQDLYEKHK